MQKNTFYLQFFQVFSIVKIKKEISKYLRNIITHFVEHLEKKKCIKETSIGGGVGDFDISLTRKITIISLIYTLVCYISVFYMIINFC